MSSIVVAFELPSPLIYVAIPFTSLPTMVESFPNLTSPSPELFPTRDPVLPKLGWAYAPHPLLPPECPRALLIFMRCSHEDLAELFMHSVQLDLPNPSSVEEMEQQFGLPPTAFLSSRH